MKKVAIVTGGRTGIGLATVKRFIEQGFQAVNLSRKPVQEKGCTHINADFGVLGWEQSVGPQLTPLLENSDQIVLVHNAGLHCSDSAAEIDVEGLRRSMEVNVIAPAILNSLIHPFMKRGSAIVYVGSTLSEKAVPGCASYVTSKHAVIGLMRSTCQDLAGQGIHTACVCPGFTDTEMLREHVGQSAEVLTSIASLCTQNRLVTPGEIAEVIEFCARHVVVNGSVIHANLGQIER